jgi:twitching motility protein PilT
VIFIGEIRTLDEFDIALNAAESGHLVISTLHSSDSISALTRMVGFYPTDHRESARERIAESLNAVVSQRLVSQRGAQHRVLVTEVLRDGPTVRDCIRDPKRLVSLPQVLDQGVHDRGTHTFDYQLLRLVQGGVITADTAQAAARSPKDLIRSLKLGR